LTNCSIADAIQAIEAPILVYDAMANLGRRSLK